MSEWKIREEFAFLKHPVYQVYKLKEASKPDTRENREVLGNYKTKEYAEVKAKGLNGCE